MKIYKDLRDAVSGSWERLLRMGKTVKAKNWQGKEAPADMFEVLWITFQVPMPQYLSEATELLNPNEEWADMHFQERIYGHPFNPPPSHEIWPHNQSGNKDFLEKGVFDHTYPERFWPKSIMGERGIRFEIGDFGDLLNKLASDEETRQAFLPIWFPEDTGKRAKVRVPCSIGYHFLIRNGYLHITYWMRSVDMIRHFQDDLYLCYKLAHHVAVELSLRLSKPIQLGYMVYQGVSCHIFESDRQALEYKLKKWKRRE